MVLALVSGRVDPALRWLAPPSLTTARALAGSLSWATGVLVTAWALGWAAMLLPVVVGPAIDVPDVHGRW
ncbi:hypothetical protein ACIBO1_05485 [Micromonospora sp. NPDC049903]|uniref:hypothetical protein n=1 Tax=Micromonospora sp. NPDC049903 TaxID=3364276 RepID=UPI00378B2B65